MVVFSVNIVNLLFKDLSPDTALITVKMQRYIALTIFFTGIINIYSVVINSYELFVVPALSQMLVTLSTILCVVLFARTWGIYVLAAGIITGQLMQSVILFFYTSRIGFKSGFKFDFSIPPDLKDIYGKLQLFLFLGMLAGLYTITNRVIASMLPQGSISALGYADRILQVPMLIISGSVVTAIYPFFSKMAAEGNIEELKSTISKSIRMSGFIFIPFAVLLIVFSRPIIEVLFQRGAFTSSAAEITSKALLFLSVSLFFAYAQALLMRVFFVYQDFKNIFVITLFGILSNIVFSLVLIKFMNPPCTGIALSNSLSVFFSCILMYYILKVKFGYMYGLNMLKSLLRTFMFSLASGAAAFIIYKNPVMLSINALRDKLILLAAACSAACLVYAALNYIFKNDESSTVLGIAKTKYYDLVKGTAA